MSSPDEGFLRTNLLMEAGRTKDSCSPAQVMNLSPLLFPSFDYWPRVSSVPCPGAKQSVPKQPVSRWHCRQANPRGGPPTTCTRSWVTTPCEWSAKVEFMFMSQNERLFKPPTFTLCLFVLWNPNTHVHLLRYESSPLKKYGQDRRFLLIKQWP